MNNKKDIQNLSKEIIRLENKLQAGSNKEENEQEIKKIMSSLSITEALQLDEYIMTHYTK